MSVRVNVRGECHAPGSSAELRWLYRLHTLLAEARPFAQNSRTVEPFGALPEVSSKKGPLSETVAAGCSLTSTE